MTLPKTQRQYRLVPDGLHLLLRLVEKGVPIRMPAPGEVLVRVQASSLNRRDLMVRDGFYPLGEKEFLVPLSDCAGEVVAIGAEVSGFKEGDRVCLTFSQRWLAGPANPESHSSALGGTIDGVLSDYITVAEEGLVSIPDHLSFEEAATLPCAALTAWSALMTHGHLKRNQYVLLQGTGGVALFGLQFAAAADAKPIITSSSDQKLKRARSLGAVATVNYVQEPNWSRAVKAITGGAGVDQVLELGGTDTLHQSLDVLAPGGHLAVIGGLTGFDAGIPLFPLIMGNLHVTGIGVGSKMEFERMNAFISDHKIKPVIDQIYHFDQVNLAYEAMAASGHFGKIVIRH